MNNLLCLYLRHNNLKQALAVLNKLRDIESLNPFVVSLLVILHARIALELQEDQAPDMRRRHLRDAISMGEMFLELEQEKLEQEELQLTEAAKGDRDIRLDIHQYLSAQMNYLVTLMQYEDSGNKDVVATDFIEILQGRKDEPYL